MTVFSTIHVAFKALLRNPTRALLTTLGIVIGIAAVITMMEIGNGSSQSIKSSIEKMGANTILVLPGASRRGGVSQGSGSRMTLTPEDCEAILRECTTVGRAVPVVNGQGYQAISGNINYAPRQISGSAPDFLEIRNWEIEEPLFLPATMIGISIDECAGKLIDNLLAACHRRPVRQYRIQPEVRTAC